MCRITQNRMVFHATKISRPSISSRVWWHPKMAEVEEAETCDCGKDKHFRFVKWCEKHCIQTAGGRCKFVVCLLVSVLCSGGIYQKPENKTKQSSKTNFPSNIHPGVKQITGWFGSVCLLFVFCCVLWIYLPNAPGECVFVKTEYVWWTHSQISKPPQRLGSAGRVSTIELKWSAQLFGLWTDLVIESGNSAKT